MIKLTLNPYLEATPFSTSKKKVLIGSDGNVDLAIGTDAAFLKEPIEIVQSDGQYFLQVNDFDSSITLNGQPVLSKEKIISGDRLYIGNAELLFEQVDAQEDLSDWQHLSAYFDHSKDDEKIHLSDAEIDELLKQLEDIQQHDESPVSKQELNKERQKLIVDDAVDSLTPLKTSNSLFPKGIFFLFLLLFCLSSASYLFIKRENVKNELDAARGIADLSMVLTHAKLQHVQVFGPMNQQIMEQHINAVLSPAYRHLSSLTNLGHLKNSEYDLRLISTNDMSHTVLVAIPKETLFQRIIPKSAFIIDSKTMEVCRTDDTSQWELLLNGKETLDEYSPGDIENLIKAAERLPLTFLDGGRLENGFAPPNTSDHSQLEHHIYNAPRYYMFTKPLLEQAIALNKSPNHELHEVASLLHMINGYSSLPNLIVYSPEGFEGVYQELKKYAPQHHFLLADVHLEPKSGIILGATIANESEFEVASEEPKSRISIVSEAVPTFKPAEIDYDSAVGLIESNDLLNEEDALSQRIEQLSSLLNNRQQLWENLLSAEKSYCSIPELALRNSLREFPLIIGQENKERFERYIEKKLFLIAEENTNFKPQEEKLLLQHDLHEILTDTLITRNNCYGIRQEMETYIERLNHFVYDLTRSKEEGCFINNRQFHQLLLNNTRQNLKMAKKLKQHLFQTTETVLSICQEQEEMAQEQLEAVEGNREYTPNDLQNLEKRWHNLTATGMIVDSLHQMEEKLDHTR
ncbi:MAG: hypothetical protein JHC93_00375 [Parachlamydiales bacterium]|nr:hypothetical protein [Parachlamydiales bacterium]